MMLNHSVFSGLPARYPRLLDESPEERSQFTFIGGGEGIHWPALDGNISVGGLHAHRLARAAAVIE